MNKQMRRLYIKFRNQNPSLSREAAKDGFKRFLKEREEAN